MKTFLQEVVDGLVAFRCTPVRTACTDKLPLVQHEALGTMQAMIGRCPGTP